jgi:hypothetical protein
LPGFLFLRYKPQAPLGPAPLPAAPPHSPGEAPPLSLRLRPTAQARPRPSPCGSASTAPAKHRPVSLAPFRLCPAPSRPAPLATPPRPRPRPLPGHIPPAGLALRQAGGGGGADSVHPGLELRHPKPREPASLGPEGPDVVAWQVVASPGDRVPIPESGGRRREPAVSGWAWVPGAGPVSSRRGRHVVPALQLGEDPVPAGAGA